MPAAFAAGCFLTLKFEASLKKGEECIDLKLWRSNTNVWLDFMSSIPMGASEASRAGAGGRYSKANRHLSKPAKVFFKRTNHAKTVGGQDPTLSRTFNTLKVDNWPVRQDVSNLHVYAFDMGASQSICVEDVAKRYGWPACNLSYAECKQRLRKPGDGQPEGLIFEDVSSIKPDVESSTVFMKDVTGLWVGINYDGAQYYPDRRLKKAANVDVQVFVPEDSSELVFGGQFAIEMQLFKSKHVPLATNAYKSVLYETPVLKGNSVVQRGSDPPFKAIMAVELDDTEHGVPFSLMIANIHFLTNPRQLSLADLMPSLPFALNEMDYVPPAVPAKALRPALSVAVPPPPPPPSAAAVPPPPAYDYTTSPVRV